MGIETTPEQDQTAGELIEEWTTWLAAEMPNGECRNPLGNTELHVLRKFIGEALQMAADAEREKIEDAMRSR